MRAKRIVGCVTAAAALVVLVPGCTPEAPPGPECTAADACRSNADCPSGRFCTSCECLENQCPADATCQTDADCPAGARCRFMFGGAELDDCVCEDAPSPLSPSGLATLTGSGLAASGHFEEIEGCPGPSSFDAGLTITVATPGADGTSAIETVQQPGDQRATGTLRTDLTFVVRDTSSSYDELYVAVFERTPGTDPAEPLTVATLLARGININGAEGLLAPVDDARVDAAVAAGLFEPATQPAALAGLLDGITGACVLGVDVTFAP